MEQYFTLDFQTKALFWVYLASPGQRSVTESNGAWRGWAGLASCYSVVLGVNVEQLGLCGKVCFSNSAYMRCI